MVRRISGISSTLETVDVTKEGNFHQRDRDAMFLPWQLYEGLRMTVLSLKAVVPYLLNNGMKYVLSESFVKTTLKIILENKEPSEEEKTIRTSGMQAIMTT